MAKESVKILRGKLDVDNLLSQLNAALAEEWLAYYQYWVGALVVEGAMRSDVQGEFEEHAEEERHHAQLLADRIIELEGVPVLDPKQWFELARCKYDSPTDFDVVSLLNQNPYSVTRLSTTGGFLKKGNTTLMIGVEDEKVEAVIALIKQECGQHQKLTVNMP